MKEKKARPSAGLKTNCGTRFFMSVFARTEEPEALLFLFPDRLFQHPAAVFVLIKEVGVIELVQDSPKLALAVAAERAEIPHTERDGHG